MRKLLALIVAALFVCAQTRPVLAQEPAPPSGGEWAEPGPAPTFVTDIPVVRVNFRSKTKATVFDRSTGKMLCSTPCSADVPAGTTLRTVIEGGEDEPHDFAITGQYGRAVDVDIKRGGSGALIGGIVMTGVGGLLVLSGVILLLSAAVIDEADSRTLDNADIADIYRVVGTVSIVAGVGVGVGGLAVLGSRSHEAATKQRPSRSPHDRDRNGTKEDTRAELHNSDLAVGRPRDPLAPPPAFTPLKWSVAF